MVHASLTQGPCQPGAEGKTGRDGERLFADAIKTMVSGEAVFALSMSFQTSLIRGNLLRRLSTTSRRSRKNIFPFVKNKVHQNTIKNHLTSVKNALNRKIDKTQMFF
ncbi:MULTISPECIES: hypothetical protein [unclassified Janthinobacterium]|uniref:hypothetical protein n=1 Tax=unclassified Janthinobacterium TaxID=2610881 RepID=UPI0011130A36|nr:MULTISPECIES: hypothetical protein [unclassified Janthinobacterium]